MRLLVTLALLLVTLALGLAGGAYLGRARPEGPPDAPAVAERVRELSRLQTLEVRLFKKVTFSPDPAPAASLWGEVINWARHAVREPKGRALFFADARLWVDLGKLEAGRLRVVGPDVEVVLPPVQVEVTLRPGETEVLDSNLDSQETATLFQAAQDAFRAEVEADTALKGRARESAERTLRALLLGLGFRQVRFVQTLPPPLPPG
jgi:hypothetical protein